MSKGMLPIWALMVAWLALSESPVWMKDQRLADRWDCSRGGLANARAKKTGVPWSRLPGVGVRYKLSDVEAYEAASGVTTTGNPEAGA